MRDRDPGAVTPPPRHCLERLAYLEARCAERLAFERGALPFLAHFDRRRPPPEGGADREAAHRPHTGHPLRPGPSFGPGPTPRQHHRGCRPPPGPRPPITIHRLDQPATPPTTRTL